MHHVIFTFPSPKGDGDFNGDRPRFASDWMPLPHPDTEPTGGCYASKKRSAKPSAQSAGVADQPAPPPQQLKTIESILRDELWVRDVMGRH